MTYPEGTDPADALVASLSDLLHRVTLNQAEPSTVLMSLDRLSTEVADTSTAEPAAVLRAFVRLRCSSEPPTMPESVAGAHRERLAAAWACLAEASAAPATPGSHWAQAQMLGHVSDTLISSGHVLPAISTLSSAAALLESIGDIVGSAAFHSRLGDTLLAEGAAQLAQKEFTRAVMSFADSQVPAPGDFLANNVLKWGRSLSIQGHHAQAEKHYRWGLNILSQIGAHGADATDARLLLADSLSQQGKTGEAAPEYEAGIGLLRRDPQTPGDRIVAALMALAACHQTNGEHGESIASLNAALPHLGPEDTASLAAVHFNLAHAYSTSGAPSQALLHYRQAASHYTDLGDPNSAAASWWQVSGALLELGRGGDSLEALLTGWQQLVNCGSDGDPHLVRDLGLQMSRSLIEAKRGAEAEAPARASVQAAQETGATEEEANAHISLGEALQAQDRLPEALDCYQTALQLGPSPSLAVTAGSNLAHGLMGLGRLSEAGKAFNRAVERAQTAGDEERADGLHFGAGLALRLAAPDESEQHLRAVVASTTVRKNPRRMALALLALAETLDQLGRSLESEEAYRQAYVGYKQIGQSQEAANCLGKAADAIRHQGRHQDALSVYAEAIELAEGAPELIAEARFGAGLSFYELGRHQEAEDALREAQAFYTAQNDPRTAAVCWKAIGRTLTAQGHRGEAETAYREAEIRYRQAAQTFAELGRQGDACRNLEEAGDIVRALGRHEEAIGIYREVLGQEAEADPKTVSSAHFGVGISLYKLGLFEEAEASFRQSHEMDVRHGNQEGAALCLEWIADTFASRGRQDEVEGHRRAAATAHDGLGEAQKALWNLCKAADAVRYQGRDEDAVGMYQQILRQGAALDWGAAAQAHFGVGVSLHKLGRFEEAEASFRTARPMYTEHGSQDGAAVCLEWIADTLASRGRHGEVEEYRRAAATAYDGLGEAQRALTSLLKAADAVRYQGRHEDAVGMYRDVLNQEEDLDWGTVVDARFGIGVSLHNVGLFEDAEEAFRAAQRLYTEHGSRENAALCLEWIADTFASRDGHDKAEEYRRAAATAYDGLGEAQKAHRNLLTAADEVCSQGRDHDAVGMYRDLLRREAEMNSGTAAQAHFKLGATLGRLGRLRESSIEYRLAAHAHRSNGNPQKAALSLLRAARNGYHDNQLRSAMDTCRAAIRELRGRRDPDGLRGDAQQLLGEILRMSGELDRAREAFERALFEHAHADRLEDVVDDHLLLASLLLGSNSRAAKARYLGAQAKAAAASDRKLMLASAATFAEALAGYDPAGAQLILDSAAFRRNPTEEADVPALGLARLRIGVVREFTHDGSNHVGQDIAGSTLARMKAALFQGDWESVIAIHQGSGPAGGIPAALGAMQRAETLRMCAFAYLQRDRWLEAESCADQSLRLLDRMPDGPLKWDVVFGVEQVLGIICTNTGRMLEASHHFGNAASTGNRSTNPILRVAALISAGQSLAMSVATGDGFEQDPTNFEKAVKYFYDAALQAHDAGLHGTAMEADFMRAVAYQIVDDYQFSLKILEFDLEYAHHHGMNGMIPRLMRAKADCLKEMGEADAFLSALRQAAEAAEEQSQFEELGTSLRELAWGAAELGKSLDEVGDIARSAAAAYRKAGLPQSIALLRLDVVYALWGRFDSAPEGIRAELLASALSATRFLDSIRYEFLSTAQRMDWLRNYEWGRDLTFAVAARVGGPDAVSDLIESQINASVFGAPRQDGTKSLGSLSPSPEPPARGSHSIGRRPGSEPLADLQLAATASGSPIQLLSSALPISPPPNLLIPSRRGCRVALAQFVADEDLILPSDEASVRTW